MTIRALSRSEGVALAARLARVDLLTTDLERCYAPKQYPAYWRILHDLWLSEAWVLDNDGEIDAVVYIATSLTGRGVLHGYFFDGQLRRALFERALAETRYSTVRAIVPEYAAPVANYLRRKLGFRDVAETNTKWSGIRWKVAILERRREE